MIYKPHNSREFGRHKVSRMFSSRVGNGSASATLKAPADQDGSHAQDYNTSQGESAQDTVPSCAIKYQSL